MTPESELLLACARPAVQAAALRELAGRPIDWARWLELADWHIEVHAETAP